jgi:hypothetical protein
MPDLLISREEEDAFIIMAIPRPMCVVVVVVVAVVMKNC